MLIATWLLLALLVFWGLGAYHRLTRLRAGIGSAWQQLEPALRTLASAGQQLAERGRAWLPAEGSALDHLMQTSADLQTAVQAVAARPHAAEPVAQLAVAQALHAAALQRARSLLALVEHDEPDAERRTLLVSLQGAEQQRDFARQLFNQRVQGFNEAQAAWPTRALTGLFGFHDAGLL